MTPEEDIKKTEEEEKKREEKLTARVAREAEQIRKDTEARFKAELDTLRATNTALQAEIQKRNEAQVVAVNAEIEVLRGEVDEPLREIFDDLPAEMSPEVKRDWLKKQMGRMPAPPPGDAPKMPVTPNSKKKILKEFVPYDKIDNII
jgi:hypothetical protein